MILQQEILLADIALMDREAFCNARCGTNEKCFFCNGLDLDDIKYWIDDVGKDRYLYLLEARDIKMSNMCIWCKKSLRKRELLESHISEQHTLNYEHLILDSIQRELYKELLRVRRTGRWWAEAFTYWRCPLCENVDGICKPLRSIGKTNKNRIGCIYSMGFDLPLPEQWYYYGVVIV